MASMLRHLLGGLHGLAAPGDETSGRPRTTPTAPAHLNGDNHSGFLVAVGFGGRFGVPRSLLFSARGRQHEQRRSSPAMEPSRETIIFC